MTYFTNNKLLSMKSIIVALFSFLAFGAFAQTEKKPASASCFNEWFALLKERGAKPIPTGTQDVIIAVRKGEYSECYLGRVDVMDGKINGRIQVQKVDGTYEE